METKTNNLAVSLRTISPLISAGKDFRFESATPGSTVFGTVPDSSILRTDKLWPMHRRDFLAGFAASVGALGAGAQERVGRSKIVEIRLLRLRMVKDVGTLEPAWDKGGAMRFTIGGGSVLQIRTDQGLTGIGPGIDPALLESVQQQLIGRDPFDTEQHSAHLRYYASGASYRG